MTYTDGDPKVSVIMGVYNCKDFQLLKKSIDSIIVQTFTEWEFIICDDGSTNATLQNLNEAALIDTRIKVISYKQNKGLAYALNQCIKVSRGEYIARQDDDDISEAIRLQEQVEFMNAHPEHAIVGTNARVFDDSGFWGTYTNVESPDKKSFLWNSPFAHPTVMMRRDALLKADCYRVAKETRRCEDYDLFMRMYALGYKGYNIQKMLYQYRIVNDNKKYRPMKYRLDETKVRFIGYKKLGMLPSAWAYVLKPVVIGLIPQCIFKKIREKQYSK